MWTAGQMKQSAALLRNNVFSFFACGFVCGVSTRGRTDKQSPHYLRRQTETGSYTCGPSKIKAWDLSGVNNLVNYNFEQEYWLGITQKRTNKQTNKKQIENKKAILTVHEK